MTNERYVSYQLVHELAHKLAQEIDASGWEPDLIVAIASGGFIPARILKTYLKRPIYVVGLQRYDESKVIYETPVKIQWIDEVEEKLGGKKVLLVDEIDDTRTTLAYCTRELLAHDPAEIRVAVLHYKDKPKAAQFPAEIDTVYVGERIPDDWVKYPWDALDIREHDRKC